MRPQSDNSRIELQARDHSLLRGMFESRIMGLDHVAAIWFDGHRAAAEKRVQKLKAGGYLAERPRRPYERSLLHLTRKAFDALRDGGHLAAYPSVEWPRLRKRLDVSPFTIAHETAVLDVKAAFATAVAKLPGLALLEFCTWPGMLQFPAAPRPGVSDVLVKPDGFSRIRQTSGNGPPLDHTFYLEVDRSTEPQGTLVVRAACYRDHYRRGGLAARLGGPRDKFEQFPFLLLMILRTVQRRDNVAENLLLMRPPILSQVWLTTQEEVTRDPLGPIWLRPMDYRKTAKYPTGVPVDAGEPGRTGRGRLPRPSTPQKVPLIDLHSEFERNLRLF
jgi:hypothetical protein